jgi:hypothetical protein
MPPSGLVVPLDLRALNPAVSPAIAAISAITTPNIGKKMINQIHLGTLIARGASNLTCTMWAGLPNISSGWARTVLQ